MPNTESEKSVAGLTPERELELELRINRRVGRGHHNARGLSTWHLDEGDWTPRFPGAEHKLLMESDREQVCLWRLAPGASLPEHDHREDEESVLLDGDMWIDGEFCEKGDFHRAVKGSRHSRLFTVNGALLLVRCCKSP